MKRGDPKAAVGLEFVGPGVHHPADLTVGFGFFQ
jgi:hypothetical protein